MDHCPLIVGLGNPGGRYERTRHNAGFLVLDRLAERLGASWKSADKFLSELAPVESDGCRVLLCKPQTFMNASGQAVGPLLNFYRVPLDRLMVVVDDADLKTGGLRLRPQGSSGGHHGLESVARHVGGTGFARQRIGIGREHETRREITGHVLGRFDAAEWPLMQHVFDRAGAQLECWLRHGIEKAMNQYNGAVVAPADQKDRL